MNNKVNKVIYMDNAATTPIKEDVLNSMIPYLTRFYGNPSSLYGLGYKSKEAISNARNTIAETINCDNPQHIIFTSGGTEADNMALKCVLRINKTKKHIITSKIEHHAILNTCSYLETIGYEVTYVDVDENGLIKLDQLEAAIREDTILISVMFANNEIGTIQPIKKIGEIAKKHGVLFHTDAVQAYGHVDIDVKELNINFLSVSGHKINAPKGVGFLYTNMADYIEPILFGGHQEFGLRAGTENVAGIVGLAKACSIACKNIKEKEEPIHGMRNYAINRLLSEIDGVRINGFYDKSICNPLDDKRLSNNINICIPNITGENLVSLLNYRGIYTSSGSACMSDSLEPSHVLQAIGVPDDIINNSLRLTLSEDTKSKDINYVIENLVNIVNMFN